ncbi:peptidylprolyl isomerase [bacterium]|nr:peptidylprolyl isomerase [bacterium]
MRRLIIFAMILGAFILAGCGRKVVAVVNGEKITKEELRNEAEKVAGRDVLVNLIREKLILQAAKKEGVYPSNEEVEKELEFRKRENPNFMQDLEKQNMTLEEYKKQLIQSLAEINLITKGITVTDKEIEEAFKKYKPMLDRVRLRWIVNVSEEEIKKAKEKLAAGAFFETVAKDSSQDTTTKEKGGDMGYVSLGQLRTLSPKIADLAMTLPLGKVSDIIKISNAYVIIRVEDRRIATLDSWKDFLRRSVMLEKANKEGRAEKVLKPIFEKATIEIKDPLYKGLETDIVPLPLP